jgi:gliding motility-associated-like protein
LWIFVSGSGNLSDPFSNNTLIDDIGLGLNMIVYQMNTDNCLPTTDTIIIVSSLCDGFTPEFPTVITPNLDGKNDIFVIDYLDQLYPECRVTVFNRWGSVVYESVGYEDPWNGTFKGEELPMGTYFYKIELNDDKATVYNGPISIIR